MALHLVTQFQSGFVQYTVEYDDIIGVFDVEETGVDYNADTQQLAGVLLSYYCDGVDAVEFYSQDGFPYAYKQINANSPACGYNPVDPGDPLDVSVVATNETGYQANDGTAQPTVTGGSGTYLYSLDGVSFSPYTGQLLSGLTPGNYTLTIQDSNGSQKTAMFTINAVAPIMGCTDPTAANYDPNAQVDNGTCIYPDPTTDEDTRLNIYETIDQFRLIDSTGNIYLTEEPRGWDDVTFRMKRDERYHGVNYEFSDGSIQLDFDVEAGKELLRSEYDENGNDGFMRFQFGAVYPDGRFIPDIDAYVDFNTKTNDRDFFSVSVKTKRFDDAVETKNEIDVTLKDGYFNMPLHSKEIQRKIIVNRNFKTTKDNLGPNEVGDPNPNGYVDAPGASPFNVYWTFLDFSQPAEGESGYSSFVNDLAPNAPLFGTGQSNPVNVSLYWFITDGGGLFAFNIAFSLKLKGKVLSPPVGDSRFGYYSYKWFLVHNTTYYELPGSVNGFTNSRFRDIDYSTNYNKTLTLNQGDRVFLFGQLVYEKRQSTIGLPSPGFESTIDLNYMNVNVSGDTISTASAAQSKLAFEVGQDILTSISGGTAKLVSNLLGRTDIGYAEDGCAALAAYTNGYLIRGFPLVDRPLIINLKDYIEGIDANYAIGMGYELNDQNQWVYRLEQFEYFYKDALIMTFDNVSDYKEAINTSLIYNKLSFGYQKYTQDLESVSTLDEFLTKHDYLTPIKSFKGELVRLCKQVASGYAIELTKRKRYSTDKEVSWAYDEENFIISTVRNQQFGFIPEKLENFTASGILSPETAYNIRWTITRMLARWGKWINSGLAFKTQSAIIENTYTAKNGDLTSQYTGDQDCESKEQFKESDDLLKGDLVGGKQSFFPEDILFKTRLSWADIRLIRRCFVNKDTLGRNNGYFGVVDGNGVTKYGFLMSLEYNPLSELATFVLRKKYVDLNEPFDCSEYTFYTFEDFEQATGLPGEIEQCLFENFA